MTKAIWSGLAAAALVAVTAAACGGGSTTTPTSPTPPTTTTPPPVTTTPPPTTPPASGNPTTATFTIGSDNRVTPSSVTIAPGGRVTIINNSAQAHDMSSDPHPEHTQCPETNQIGFLSPGQTRTSGNYNTARTCGFHDHNLPDNANLQGRIIIQ
jgi:plastocyanin